MERIEEIFVEPSIEDAEIEDCNNLEDYDDDAYYDSLDDSDDVDDGERTRSFGFYAGSWAQDVEGYSDEDIDDIFGGEPDAYWNID